ncbi:MAG: hypothetical protein QF824_06215 [Candidatus Woesearchaeota archaeon]|jgi:hypothetical protein|nr:hypothetical protein [Candidatus Woesearchaeota archaeon]MDP7457235.1 hypothetical protein [Candidatus Woesearchaeota archaeon]
MGAILEFQVCKLVGVSEDEQLEEPLMAPMDLPKLLKKYTASPEDHPTSVRGGEDGSPVYVEFAGREDPIPGEISQYVQCALDIARALDPERVSVNARHMDSGSLKHVDKSQFVRVERAIHESPFAFHYLELGFFPPGIGTQNTQSDILSRLRHEVLLGKIALEARCDGYEGEMISERLFEFTKGSTKLVYGPDLDGSNLLFTVDARPGMEMDGKPSDIPKSVSDYIGSTYRVQVEMGQPAKK